MSSPIGVPRRSEGILGFGLALLLVTACGRARYEGAGPMCSEEVSCPESQLCIDGECVMGGSGDGGSPDSGAEPQTFVDENAADFEAGELENLEFADDRLQLRSNLLVGELRSRVFDAGKSARWARISWLPARPYGKPLADGRSQDEGYQAGRVDMSENILLLHFDETGPLASRASLADASGRGNDAVLTTDVPVELTAGPFGSALEDTLTSRMTVGAGGPDLQFGTGDFTWSLWVNARAPCQDSDQNDAYIGGEEISSPRTHIWMGCLRSTGSSCPAGPPNGRPAGVVCSDQPGDCTIICGAGNLPDGRWHHLAMRKIGHPNAAVTLWFDGAIAGSGTTTLLDVLAFAEGTDLGIGHFAAPPAGDVDAQGALDEVAIFRRALTDEEMQDLFVRGAAKLRFQARVCAEPDCRDAPAFVGPDGTDASSYQDASDAPAGTPVDLGGLPEGRYFQYRALFETQAGVPSPELLRVETEAM